MEVCVKDSENYINDGDMYLEECQYHKALQVYENAEKYITNAKELAKLYIKTGVCYLEIFEYAGTGFDDASIYFELAYETAPKCLQQQSISQPIFSYYAETAMSI